MSEAPSFDRDLFKYLHKRVGKEAGAVARKIKERELGGLSADSLKNYDIDEEYQHLHCWLPLFMGLVAMKASATYRQVF